MSKQCRKPWTCRVCGKPIEEYPDAFSGGWTHADIEFELTADHTAVPSASIEWLNMPTDRNLIRHPSETPLLCAVCGCKWEAQKAPDEVCPDFYCPCHQSFWLWIQSLDENEKRAMWGDR